MWYQNYNVLSFIGLVVLVGIIATVFIYKGEKENAKKLILGLVIKAETDFGIKQGTLKFAAVVGYAYGYLPAILKLFISADTLDAIVESAVTIFKNELTPKPVVVVDKAAIAKAAAALATAASIAATTIANNATIKATEAAEKAASATAAVTALSNPLITPTIQ